MAREALHRHEPGACGERSRTRLRPLCPASLLTIFAMALLSRAMVAWQLSTDSAIYGVKIKLKVLIYRCKLRFFARFCLVSGSTQRISTAC